MASGDEGSVAIAFFDVDKTILAVNSSSGWLKREVRGGHIGHRDALRVVFWLALYNAGFSGLERVIVDQSRKMRGVRESSIVERAERFWLEEVRYLIRDGARAAIERHRERGDEIVLLTTAPSYLTASVAAEVGATAYLCNRLEVEDGAFTGRMQLPMCYGAGKVAHADEYARKVGVALADCSFYTDSYSDLPMLAVVGSPVAVHPDRRLRRHAQQRGWPIEEWVT